MITYSCKKEYSVEKISLPECKTATCIKASIENQFFYKKQPSANTCWATSLSMLFSWKNKKFTSEEEVLKNYPEYLTLFKNGKEAGISVKQEIDLYTKLGLQIERQLNPTIQGWADYILEGGPLSITIDANPPFGGTIHAITLVGIYGEQTGLNTHIVFADPADGKLHTINFLDFMKMYEAKRSVDWPIQIIHFSKIKSTSKVRCNDISLS